MKPDLKTTLKKRAHSLKPVVMIGQKGLTESVIQEIDVSLLAHELIKVKISGQDKEAKVDTVDKILAATNAHKIQLIGNILVIYRQNEDS